jgi:excinuclease ABC subunit B
MERMEIIRDLRMGKFDVWSASSAPVRALTSRGVPCGHSDADKEGFLRSETSLIQTIGRAARNVNGRVIMYADSLTAAMKSAIGETNRRRQIQNEYNRQHGITPKSIQKAVHNVIEATKAAEDQPAYRKDTSAQALDKDAINALIESMAKEMRQAARELEFERAGMLRDRIEELKKLL